MALYKIKDFASDYRNYFDGDDIIGYDLYSRTEKVGSVDDILVDDSGKLRYLVINTGVWILGKKVLLPIGCARIDSNERRVYADTLTKEQVNDLPEFNNDMTVDYDHEERVRKVYRTSRTSTATVDNPASFGVGYAGAESAPPSPNTAPSINVDTGYAGYDQDTYTYDVDPDLYDLREKDHINLRRYQERLMDYKTRQKA